MSDPSIYPVAPEPNRYGPISIGEMFERTAALLRENPRLFFGIVLVVFAVEIVVGGVLGGSSLWMGRSSTGASPVAKLFFLAPLYLLGGLLTYVFTQVVRGALFLAARARLANAGMTVGDAWRLAAESGGRLIGISILVGLRILGYLLLFYFLLGIPFVAIVMFSGMAHAGLGAFHLGHRMAPAMIGLVAIFILAAAVLYFAALLWLVTRYALAIPAALEEDVSITEAIRRSVHLGRGSKGRLYALYVGVFCAYLVIAAFVFPVQLLAAHSARLHFGHPTAGFEALNIVLRVFWDAWGAIILAFIGVATTLCYYDLRVRKEGLGGSSAAPLMAAPPLPPPPTGGWPIEDLPIS